MAQDQDNNSRECGEYKFPRISPLPSELSNVTVIPAGVSFSGKEIEQLIDRSGITAADIKEAASNFKQKRPKISYKTEWQKSSERADKLSRWALIGWALAIIEGVWLIILAYAP